MTLYQRFCLNWQNLRQFSSFDQLSNVSFDQLSLFEPPKSKRQLKNDQWLMSQEALITWKQRLFRYQQQVKENPPPQQQSLFDTPQSYCDPDTIDPFSLRLHPWDFYRMPESGDSVCTYLVIDNTLPLLLYVGETKRTAKQRWIAHDCQDYIKKYIELHRRYQMDVAICTAFWWDTPEDRKSRQQLERQLILKWRSPFNKENWHIYGQPFKKG